MSAVMTSRPDVMQLLFFLFAEKHQLTRNEGKCEERKTNSVLWFVYMSVLVFHPGLFMSSCKHRSLVSACVEN